MKFKLTPSLNDGKNDPPPIEVKTIDGDLFEIESLMERAADEMVNDYGQPFGVGFTLTIERVA